MESAASSFFCYLAGAIILWQYASALFVPIRSAKIRAATLCGLCSILYAASAAGATWLDTVLSILMAYIFLATQYSVRKWPSLFHAVILTALMDLCDLCAYKISGQRVSGSFAGTHDLPAMIVVTVSGKILYLATVHILICILKRPQRYSTRNGHAIIALSFIPMASIAIMLTFMSLCRGRILPAPLNWLVSLSAVSLLAACLLVSQIQRAELERDRSAAEMQLLLQKGTCLMEYYKTLLVQKEDRDILIHDIKKHLQSIDILNSQNEPDKIHTYIQQLLCSSHLKDAPPLCAHGMLNAILSHYKHQCDHNGISFHADIRSHATDFIDDTDLTALFCNLLDNAMTAAHGIPEAFIDTTACRKDRTPFTVITVVNSCAKDPFPLRDAAWAGLSGHGLGIKSIRSTIRNYQGDLHMYHDKDTQTFHTVITLRQ